MEILLFVLFGTFVFLGCSRPDKYDKENYIGPADLPADLEEIAKEYNITREGMSTFRIEEDIAYMSGDISSDTIRQVKKLIEVYPEVKTIHMVDVGGSVDDVSNLEASRLVRRAGLHTHVSKDGHIASGGTDFFCAGLKRTVEEGAKVGVHSWDDLDVEDAASLPRDHESHIKYIDYYEEMKMPKPRAFYFYTLHAAKADEMHYMSLEELMEYGLIET